MQVKQNDFQKYNAFIRSTGRSRSKTRHLSHLKMHDREPSRIPMKKFVNLMMKNRKKRRRIKRYIRQFIPKSSALHNLLSARYRKHASQKLTNIYMWQFRKPCRTRRMSKLIKKDNLKIANMCYSRTKQHKFCTLNNPKILSTNKCNIQRIKTSNKRFLFTCGDVELNTGPVNISNILAVLTRRLASIGRKPVNTVGDGNCFFRSISHQLYRTEDRHPQIRALAIQHLINCPEYFVEYNTDQSCMVAIFTEHVDTWHMGRPYYYTGSC